MPLKTRKRKKESGPDIKTQNGPTIEEQAALLDESEVSSAAPGRLAATDGCLAQLLTQGLQASSPNIVSSVLDRADPDLIDKTVRKLPVESVLPLLAALQTRLSGVRTAAAPHAAWLKSLLSSHTGYLLSLPDSHAILSPVYELLELKTKHYSLVFQLAGKMEMLTKQVDPDTTGGNPENADFLVYQDDSSDEVENVIDDLLVPGSDSSADDWEDDVEEANGGGSESDDDSVTEILENNNMDDNSD